MHGSIRPGIIARRDAPSAIGLWRRGRRTGNDASSRSLDEAAADARRALGLYDGLPSRSGEQWFETARCHAALAGLARREGSGVPAGEPESDAAKAMKLLSKAVSMGYCNLDTYRSESALDPLRDRSDFRLLTLDLAFPIMPFAR